MKREVMRVYDRNDPHTNTRECYFLILPEYKSEWERERDIEARYTQMSGLRWANYTSYLLGYADISPDEEYWCEQTGYELKECKIDINRVTVTGKYRLPEWVTG